MKSKNNTRHDKGQVGKSKSKSFEGVNPSAETSLNGNRENFKEIGKIFYMTFLFPIWFLHFLVLLAGGDKNAT